MNRSKKNPNSTAFKIRWSWVFLGLAFAFSVYLGWREGVAIAFAFMSMVVAAYSIGIAIRALHITRATTRPFLNICQFNVIWFKKDDQSASVKYFIVGLGNTGVFPADEVSVILKVNKPNNNDQQYSFIVDEGIPTICFPSDEIINLKFTKAEEKEEVEVAIEGELKARIEIEYRNKLTREIHKTNRSYLVKYKPETNPAPRLLPKEDFWI